MFNDPPPDRRKQHPLEQEPQRSSSSPQKPAAQQLILHIPSVKPNVTYALIAINLVIFFIRATSPQLDEQIFLWGANHQPDVLVGGELHRLFSSMFLHASIFTARGG